MVVVNVDLTGENELVMVGGKRYLKGGWMRILCLKSVFKALLF